MITSLIVAAIVVGVDQLTKFLIYGTPAGSVVGNLLWFESTLNTGVAFSMFEGMQWLFIVIASVASILFIYLIVSKKWLESKFEKISVALVLAGTVGNLIDRIIFNGVRDFIYLKFIDFAIFNIADMAIIIGTTLLCIGLLFIKKTKEETNKE